MTEDRANHTSEKGAGDEATDSRALSDVLASGEADAAVRDVASDIEHTLRSEVDA